MCARPAVASVNVSKRLPGERSVGPTATNIRQLRREIRRGEHAGDLVFVPGDGQVLDVLSNHLDRGVMEGRRRRNRENVFRHVVANGTGGARVIRRDSCHEVCPRRSVTHLRPTRCPRLR